MKILIVDDSGFSRGMMGRTLGNLGFEPDQIAHAVSGEEALTKMASQVFDLFILDIVLTGMDGVDVLREVKQQQPQAKVIMCSGSSSPDLVREIIALGIDGYVVKPYKEESLIAAICKCLPEGSPACRQISCFHARCHVCGREMIEVDTTTTITFYCPSLCMQIGPTVNFLVSQQQLDEDFAKAKQKSL